MRNIFLVLLVFTFSFASEQVQNSKLSDDVDLSDYKELKEKDNKIVFDLNSSDVDGVYNYKYSPNSISKDKEINIFIDGNFDEIHRYKSLYFNSDSLDDDSNKIFTKITKQIHKYTDDKSREIVISVLGFTQKIENKNEEVDLDSSYTDFFQSIAQRDDLNPNNANEDTINYMKIVYEKMIDDNISKEIIYKENRVGKDNLFTEEFSDGRELNNRVDVAIYVKKILDPDSDGDGVHDSKDYCPQTPIGANVDKNGCPLVMSLDLLFDFDKASISDEESLQNIQKLSDFMKTYSVYHANIIGHTDSAGAAKYNQKLSVRRAEVVKNMMIKDGVKESRLSYEGRGESEPLFENINPLNMHKNRRTEVELTIPKEKTSRAKPSPRSRSTKD